MKVDFYRHDLSSSDASRVADVLGSPFLTTGKVSREVEAGLCQYFDIAHSVLVSSWTSGATALLLAMGVGQGDEVIVPAMTFIASANVVEMVGATTVLVDVDPGTLLMTPDAVSKAVTAKTKAIIPVHLYGQMVDIVALRQAAESKAQPGQYIYILEDCAHCFEGTLRAERPGLHSDAACFSFYATKNVTCGEGGAIIVRDSDLYERVLETRLHGMTVAAVDRFAGGQYNHWDMKRLGIKANLPDILAALLPDQIKTIDKRLAHRDEIVERYNRAFSESPLRSVLPVPGCRSANHLYTVGVPSAKRDEAISILNRAGIGVTVNYRALPELTYYAKRYPAAALECPVAMAWGSETISLPLYTKLSTAEQDYIIRIMLENIHLLIS